MTGGSIQRSSITQGLRQRVRRALRMPDDPAARRRLFASPPLDAVLIGACIAGAFALRFDGHIPNGFIKEMAFLAAVATVVTVAVLLLAGFYRVPWRMMELRDMVTIGIAVFASTAVLSLIALMYHARSPFTTFPRSVVLIQAPLALVLLGGVRLVPRILGLMVGASGGRGTGARGR